MGMGRLRREAYSDVFQSVIVFALQAWGYVFWGARQAMVGNAAERELQHARTAKIRTEPRG
ncbi:hypothetical protein N657DRAFT_647448 [Parathielavia appendiculata]|uniref:Uncharacterized protein n=1 Tax=Parathielavia appendiculata TaxID=2587402 RepID=A0AAN6Z201_9PEZI|nr:hypothetical protein N657DRAFT_647448 [Parathielavia appendiculata]